MRRQLATLGLLLAFGAALLSSASVAAQIAGEHVVLTPADGTFNTHFTFTGSGYQPGRVVYVRIATPDGLSRRFYADDGVELVWLAGADGTFTLELTPALRFPTAPAGVWIALFCAQGSSTCQQIEFDVLP